MTDEMIIAPLFLVKYAFFVKCGKGPPCRRPLCYVVTVIQAETYTPSLITTATGILETSPLEPQVMALPVSPS